MAGMGKSFQFSLGHIFWATFWVATLLALWQITGYLDESGSPMQVRDHRGQIFVVSSVMFLSAGIGALNGRPKAGAAIGTLAALFVAYLLTPTVSRWMIYIMLR
jgi:hypothetical protein